MLTPLRSSWTREKSDLPKAAPRESFAFVSSGTPDADDAVKRLAAIYGQTPMDQADVIVALGGDGFLLQTLRETMSTGKLRLRHEPRHRSAS